MKARTVARCQSCGAQTARWVGRCPECGEWGSVVEEPVASRAARANGAPIVPAKPLADADDADAARTPTGHEEVDRVLGGGLVRGSVALLAGEPGIGKSTLALQMAASIAIRDDVLLVCGEESQDQVRARAGRVGGVRPRMSALSDTSMPSVIAAVEAMRAGGTMFVDSVQTLFDPEIASAPGSVAQVRECGAALARAARAHGVTVVLVGHVTKEGAIAGPRVLEHLVDVVLTFDGERQGALRVLRALKNRFGSTQEAGFFEMTADGLVPIRDASGYLLQDRCTGLAGSVLAASVEGRRPLVLEVQALVGATTLPMPRRTALGVDAGRLPLLVAVLQRRMNVPLGDKDVYVSAVGGIRVAEPAADLPVALAILSAWKDAPLPDDVVAFGEVGLAGEVRQVAAPERRLAEARAIGCRAAVVPHGMHVADPGVELIRVRHVRDALAVLLASSA